MKLIKILKFLLGIIILFSIITVSCQRTDLNNESAQKPADEVVDNTSNDV